MSRCRISNLLQFLKENHLAPKRTLSQNFLIDENVVDKIVGSLQLQPGDHVLEIGPGAGALTEKLCENEIHLTCVEKDSSLNALLDFPSMKAKSFYTINQDIMLFDFQKCIPKNLKIISNLPYHITSKILKLLAKKRAQIELCILMVEKGYAEDLIKAKTEGDYDATSFILHHAFEASVLFNVSKNCFYPKPKIDSSILLLKPKACVDQENSYIGFIEILFTQKRKMVGSILKNCFSITKTDEYPQLNQIFQLRPELLTDDQTYEIFSIFYDEIDKVVQEKEEKTKRYKMRADESQND